MKQKISISIEEETINLLGEIIKDRRFRNKSHVIEYALIKFLEEQNGN